MKWMGDNRWQFVSVLIAMIGILITIVPSHWQRLLFICIVVIFLLFCLIIANQSKLHLGRNEEVFIPFKNRQVDRDVLTTPDWLAFVFLLMALISVGLGLTVLQSSQRLGEASGISFVFFGSLASISFGIGSLVRKDKPPLFLILFGILNIIGLTYALIRDYY